MITYFEQFVIWLVNFQLFLQRDERSPVQRVLRLVDGTEGGSGHLCPGHFYSSTSSSLAQSTLRLRYLTTNNNIITDYFNKETTN